MSALGRFLVPWLWWVALSVLLLAVVVVPGEVSRWRARRRVLSRRVALLAVDAVVWSFADCVAEDDALL